MQEENLKPLSFRPAAGYYRRAVRDSETLEGCRKVALWAIDELEDRNAQLREHGIIPRRLYNPRVIGPDGLILEDDERQMELFG